MDSNTRLIVNTLAQNIRTFLNIVLSLYATRIVMEVLGQSDYGIYMLVAGIVTLLSYLMNALVGTTQRHLSFAHGQDNLKTASLIFANSYLLQWILGGVLSLIAILFTSIIFDSDFLNIPTERVIDAKFVYIFVISSVFFTFLASSFKALLVSYENIVYTSVVDVLDGVLKLSLVFLLYMVDDYKLTLYAVVISSVQLFNLFMLAGYCKLHYRETILVPHLRLFDLTIMKDIISFAVWKLYETFSIFFRTQGVSIILNRRLGTLINAAYGVASQVYGSLQFFSEAILNAMRPQIIQAEGKGDREHMIHLSECACRYCFFMMALLSIPIIFEIPSILNLWLNNVPENTVLFSRTFMIAALIDQLTIGLGIANNAIGQIRNYTIVVFSLKAVTVPVVALLLYNGLTITAVMYAYIGFESLSAVVRLPLLISSTDLSLKHYLSNVPIKLLIPTSIMVLTAYLCCFMPSRDFRFILTGVVCVLVGCVSFWFTGTFHSERLYIINMVKNKIKK